MPSDVTAAFTAIARPTRLLPLVRVTLALAKTLPCIELVVPSVAELPMRQKTLQGLPLPAIVTADPLAVVSAVPS